MTQFHLFLQDSVRLETAPTGGVRKSYNYSYKGRLLDDRNKNRPLPWRLLSGTCRL